MSRHGFNTIGKTIEVLDNRFHCIFQHERAIRLESESYLTLGA